jgi:hypothetical protein
MPRKEASLCFVACLLACREAAARPCSLRQASFCSVLISFTTVVVEGAERFLLFLKKNCVSFFAFHQRIRISLRTGFSIYRYYGEGEESTKSSGSQLPTCLRGVSLLFCFSMEESAAFRVFFY